MNEETERENSHKPEVYYKLFSFLSPPLPPPPPPPQFTACPLLHRLQGRPPKSETDREEKGERGTIKLNGANPYLARLGGKGGEVWKRREEEEKVAFFC